MPANLADRGELMHLAREALGRYKLRTFLSVLGVVLGVAAVIAMMSVSEGARREALAQMDALGLNNLVARTVMANDMSGRRVGLTADDAERAAAAVPMVVAASPLVARFLPVARAGSQSTMMVVGTRPAYQTILRLPIDAGRFLASTDESGAARVCVLGAAAARTLFGYRDAVGDHVRISGDYYEVVGVLRELGTGNESGNAFAWRDVNQTLFVPIASMTGRTLDAAPGQPVDEVWLQVARGELASELGTILERVLAGQHAAAEFAVVVPRELLAERQRTQRTFGIVIGSVAALTLIVGGIGIMNIMLTSVVERTHEIGVRRTVGATRRDVRRQFLTETLLMTLSGGAIGIVAGVGLSWAIAYFAGWETHVSFVAIVLGFTVSILVGVTFGLYPAIKAGELEPVDAMRYE